MSGIGINPGSKAGLEAVARMLASLCEICEYASEHGSWPTDHRGTHCKGCHRSWTGLAQSHCTVCHRHFGSDAAGDAHWPGKGSECQDPEGYRRYETRSGVIFGGIDPKQMEAMRQSPRRPPSHSAETPRTETP